jgi:DNA gyrase subunit A
MIGFGVDEAQAEYVAEIRLRHLNREYILNRTAEIDSLKSQIAEMREILDSPKKIDALIIGELRAVAKKFGEQRRTLLYYPSSDENGEAEEDIPDYPVNLFFTREGYFKKITPLSLRMGGEQTLKEGDSIARAIEATNSADLLFFTNKQQVYKANASDFSDTKASVMGEYIPAKLGMDEGETALYMAVTKDYSGYMLFFFENGKAAKVDLSGYATKTRRRKLLAAYSDKSPLVAMYQIAEDGEFALKASNNRMLIIHTGAMASKAAKDTLGVQVMTLNRKNLTLASALPYFDGMVANPHRFRAKAIPATGSFPRAEDEGEQLSL